MTQNKNKIIIAILSVAAVGIIAAIIIVLITRSSSPASETTEITQVLPDLPYPEQSADYSPEVAQEIIFNESTSDKTFEEFVAVCENQIALAPTPEYRAEVYLSCAAQLATFYPELGSQLLLDYAYKAEAIAPSVSTANAIAAYEYSAGNQAVAEKYTKILEEREAADPVYQQTLEEIRANNGGSKN